MIYSSKPELVNVTQWFKHGDSPDVEDYIATWDCSQMNGPVGRITGTYGSGTQCVYPGMYIVVHKNGYIEALTYEQLIERYEKVDKISYDIQYAL